MKHKHTDTHMKHKHTDTHMKHKHTDIHEAQTHRHTLKHRKRELDFKGPLCTDPTECQPHTHTRTHARTHARTHTHTQLENPQGALPSAHLHYSTCVCT